MRHSRCRSLGSIGVAVLTLGMILSGCGTSLATPGGQQAAAERTAAAAAQATPVSTATNDPLPTVVVTPDPATLELAGCPPPDEAPTQYGTADGLTISIPHRYTEFDYPSELMPNNEPNAPYKVPLTASEAEQVDAFQPNPPVNPSLSEGYLFQVCNQTSAAHTVSSLSVTIASFTPSSGPITVWHVCQDGPYDAATKANTGGCGGGSRVFDSLVATLQSDSTGASAPATANTVGDLSGPNLPIVIGPNESMVFLIAVNGLTSQGTYALSFGVSIDGAAPTPVTPSDGSFLIAPAAIVWTGTACQTPAMLAQIPPASQDTYYVCPPAA